LRSHGDLGTNVAELSGNSKDELLVLPERLVLESSERCGLLGLESHIGIGDFGDGCEEENYSKKEHKGSNGEVCPLHVFLVGCESRAKVSA